jgi:hypothetical protein
VKRILAISLLSFVLLAGSRMAVNLHYCGGKLASIEFFPEKKEACGKCGMKKSKTCCQDLTKVFHSEDHSLTSFSFDFTTQIPALPVEAFSKLWNVPVFVEVQESTFWAHAPPYWDTSPRYIRFRSLII